MNLEIEIEGKVRRVELTRDGSRVQCRVDGRLIEADVAEIAAGNYSVLVEGKSVEARVEPRGAGLQILSGGREFLAEVRDPRRYRRGGAGHAVAGSQNVVAPMPGKVVRVLVKVGDAVAAGQGIAVVEAMKMQNEVKSRNAGTVQKVLVEAGRTVNSGDVLAVVS